MTKRTFAAALAGALAAVIAAPVSAAAQGAAAQALPPGPAISGLCFVSMDGVLATSTVGKFVASRLQQLAQAAQSELDSSRSSIQNDEKALETQKASLSATQYDQRAAALAVREREWERTAQQRNQELGDTKNKAVEYVLGQAGPVIREAFQQRGCAVLLERGTVVLFSSSTVDLTPAVVTGLNGKITQFTFDREHLEQSAAPAGQ